MGESEEVSMLTAQLMVIGQSMALEDLAAVLCDWLRKGERIALWG